VAADGVTLTVSRVVELFHPAMLLNLVVARFGLIDRSRMG
jgi:hypothetical protein